MKNFPRSSLLLLLAAATFLIGVYCDTPYAKMAQLQRTLASKEGIADQDPLPEDDDDEGEDFDLLDRNADAIWAKQEGYDADPDSSANDTIIDITDGGLLRRSSHICREIAWGSKDGTPCVVYETGIGGIGPNEWDYGGPFCTPDGEEGSGWADRWGTLEDFANQDSGTHAGQACCACGGGHRSKKTCWPSNFYRVNTVWRTNYHNIVRDASGFCITFNGASSYVDMNPNHLGPASLSYGQHFSIAALIKIHHHGDWPRIVEMGQGGLDHLMYLGLKGKSRKLHFKAIFSEGGEWNHVSSPEPLPHNQWVHVAVTVDQLVGQPGSRNARVILYVDGAEVSRNTFYDDYVDYIDRSENFIGKSAISSKRYFKGKIAQFKIFDRTLTPNDVGQLSAGNVEAVDSYNIFDPSKKCAT